MFAVIEKFQLHFEKPYYYKHSIMPGYNVWENKTYIGLGRVFPRYSSSPKLLQVFRVSITVWVTHNKCFIFIS
jgi:hypothetical protein